MDFTRHLRLNSERFREVMASVRPDAPVPSCPGWDAAELLWHLTEVQMFWGLIVEHGLSDPSRAEELKTARPGSYQDLLAMFDSASSRLSRVLEGGADDAPAWTWSDDHTVGFIRRRQAHEALIHRVDAERAAGVPSEVTPELATDGIDELFTVFVGGIPGWAVFEPDGSRLQVDAIDARHTWHLAFGRMKGTSPTSGTDYDLPAAEVAVDAVPPDTLIAGTAPDLDLWLWGRGSIDPMIVTGDPDLADRLRSVAAEVTQ
jgi:uncharacterized protein (TIGR03083 family)